jgi:hypothetical protein
MKSDKILTGVEVVQATTEQDQVTPPNDKEIYKICKVLANKYNSPNHYDDLISEGLVACYECRESGKARKADYVGSARRAMNDYINIKRIVTGKQLIAGSAGSSAPAGYYSAGDYTPHRS